jgi:hypothetical protein
MIAYTITVPKTTAHVVAIRTYSGVTHQNMGQTLPEFTNGQSIFTNGDAAAELWAEFIGKHNGTTCESTNPLGEITYAVTKEDQEKYLFELSGLPAFDISSTYREELKTNSDGWAANSDYFIVNDTGTNNPSATIGGNSTPFNPQNFNYTYLTTVALPLTVRVSTTHTQQVDTTIITTSGEASAPFLTEINAKTTITASVMSEMVRNITIVNEYETELPVRSDAPRATATVFCQGWMHFLAVPNSSECVWIVTASDLNGAGPWKLTDIASSFTATTARPIYKTTSLKVVNESNRIINTWLDDSGNAITGYDYFPLAPDPMPVQTIPYTTTIETLSIRTIWTTGSNYDFPLESHLVNVHAITTTNQNFLVDIFTENNPLFTESVVLFGTKDTASMQLIESGMTYQQFYSHSYTTTRHVETFSSTSSTSYEGFYSRDYGNRTVYYQNISESFTEGMTVYGTNVEQVLIRQFTPCAIFRDETSFTDNWGLYGALMPHARIVAGASLHWETFAELYPGVSIPYPTSTSWTTNNASISANIIGNAITLTTKNAVGSGTSAYKFQGTQLAHTDQRTGREFLISLNGLPYISRFGPHAATGDLKARARPGTYVSIVQDSLGDYTLSTLTYENSLASVITANAILFPAENTFYTTPTIEGYAYIVLPRNPIP